MSRKKKTGAFPDSGYRPATRLTHLGNTPFDNHGIINPPVYHASTVLFPSLKALRQAIADPFGGTYYGRMGTPTSAAFETAVAAMEGGDQAVATSSGLAAITCALLAFLSAGDDILVTDTAYQPTRKFCDGVLRPLGVGVRYYDPLVGSGITDLLNPRTRVIFMESPGSLTFEVQDIAAIVEAAQKQGCITIIDNTWATPLGLRPLDCGVDISIQSATKYIVGHTDAMLGAIICRQEHFSKIKTMVTMLGNAPGPDDCYLGLRGLRTLDVRLPRHAENGLILAEWLQQRREVAAIFHPALPGDRGHHLWQRDFRAACGLFSCQLHPCSQTALAAFLDGLALFGMGFSWGGYESLILPVDPRQCRTATAWEAEGPLLRVHSGLEDIADLKADLAAGFDRMAKA